MTGVKRLHIQHEVKNGMAQNMLAVGKGVGAKEEVDVDAPQSQPVLGMQVPPSC